jgi:hypothetical protein
MMTPYVGGGEPLAHPGLDGFFFARSRGAVSNLCYYGAAISRLSLSGPVPSVTWRAPCRCPFSLRCFLYTAGGCENPRQ